MDFSFYLIHRHSFLMLCCIIKVEISKLKFSRFPLCLLMEGENRRSWGVIRMKGEFTSEKVLLRLLHTKVGRKNHVKMSSPRAFSRLQEVQD